MRRRKSEEKGKKRSRERERRKMELPVPAGAHHWVLGHQPAGTAGGNSHLHTGRCASSLLSRDSFKLRGRSISLLGF